MENGSNKTMSMAQNYGTQLEIWNWEHAITVFIEGVMRYCQQPNVRGAVLAVPSDVVDEQYLECSTHFHRMNRTLFRKFL